MCVCVCGGGGGGERLRKLEWSVRWRVREWGGGGGGGDERLRKLECERQGTRLRLSLVKGCRTG